MQEVRNAPRRVLRDDGGKLTAAGVLDAMPDHAEPGKDAVVLAEVRSELSVDALELHETECFSSSSSRIASAPSSNFRGSGGLVCRHCRLEFAQVVDEAVVVEHRLGGLPRHGRPRPDAARSVSGAGAARRRRRLRRACGSARAGCRRGSTQRGCRYAHLPRMTRLTAYEPPLYVCSQNARSFWAPLFPEYLSIEPNQPDSSS